MKKFTCFQSIQVIQKKEGEDYELNTFSSSKEISPYFLKTSPALFGIIPIEIVLYIFELLNMSSRTAMVVTCRYFKSIWKSVKELLMEIHYIIPKKDVVVNWQFLQCFERAFERIFQYLAESSPEYPTKALLWVHNNRSSDDALRLLQGFVFEYPKTPILFLKGDPITFVSKKLVGQFIKLKSLEYICMSGGRLNMNWSLFFNQFPKLKCVYFRPSIIDNVLAVTWTMNNTHEILFIMEHVEIVPTLGDIT
jgi:hypothetical protein